jgi:hypothetical protein
MLLAIVGAGRDDAAMVVPGRPGGRHARSLCPGPDQGYRRIRLAISVRARHPVPMEQPGVDPARELWGTFAVNDHCRTNAFAREVLLFDRLVLPVPANEGERGRWLRPNPGNEAETWDPERQELLLKLLGTQREKASSGAQLVWTAPWDEERWNLERSRSERADLISRYDAFYTTRMILAMDEDLPGVIEAVAAFPSRGACRNELIPRDDPIYGNVTAAEALVILAVPLLVPAGDEGKDFGPLRAAIDLARDPRFIQQRHAYHNWMRSFVAPLRAQGQPLADVVLDPSSLQLAEQRLGELYTAQRSILGEQEIKKWWQRTEWAAMVISVAVAVGLAAVTPFAPIAIAGGLIGFGGWVAGKKGAYEQPPSPDSLGGASMFVTAHKQLGWQQADLFSRRGRALEPRRSLQPPTKT